MADDAPVQSGSEDAKKAAQERMKAALEAKERGEEEAEKKTTAKADVKKKD